MDDFTKTQLIHRLNRAKHARQNGSHVVYGEKSLPPDIPTHLMPALTLQDPDQLGDALQRELLKSLAQRGRVSKVNG